MDGLMDDWRVVGRVLDHIDNGATDRGAATWREPVDHYVSPGRLERELREVFHATPTPFCPSLALAEPGAFLAREAAGTPLIAVRGADGVARVFRNACRHRGTQLACGAGKARAFVCPYHAWTYDLEGRLRSVPHLDGFPDLDTSRHGLVPVRCEEHAGLIFVTQTPAGADTPPAQWPTGLDPDLTLVAAGEQVIEANWKIVMEGFLEGYHIKATHKDTFFPRQYDNLNVVEHFGANSRVVFPYQAVERQRAVAPPARDGSGGLTYVYHLFPNVIVATFPKRATLVINEPDGAARTRQLTWTFADRATLAADRPGVSQGIDFVNEGAKEDRAVNESIQRGLASGANDAFTYGQFEAAIVHFHRGLSERLGSAV